MTLGVPPLWILWPAAAAAMLGGQTPGQGGPGSVTDTGARMFRTYCAACHGETGRGNGPMAEQLRKTLPDLTKYTARNGGVFPRERLREIIDGRGVAAHGDRDMPVWGDAFRTDREGLTPEAVRARIEAILRHLETIQERSAGRRPPRQPWAGPGPTDPASTL